MRVAAAALVALALVTRAGAASPPGPPEAVPDFAILQDGDDLIHHGGEAPLNPGPGWLALDVVDGLWHLRAATLRGEQAIDPIGEENTGVRIHATPAHAFLYLKLPTLVPGKVDTPNMRFRDHWRQFVDGQSLPLAFKGRTWRFDVRKHEVVLSEGATSISLGQVVDDSDDTFALRWAGDLDRDGRLDFIFERGANNSSEICIWLSSLAVPGKPIGEAACWLTTGC